MNTENTLHTRIILKHDSPDNWKNSEFIPDKGEVIIYDSTKTSAPIIKVGDGKQLPKDLPVSGLPSGGKEGDFLRLGANNTVKWQSVPYAEETKFGGGSR